MSKLANISRLFIVLLGTWGFSLSFAQDSDPETPPAPQPPCTSDAYRAFDFWIGNWRVTTPAGQHAGDNTITSAANGCLLIENWQGAQGGTGQSYNFYDVHTEQWRQLWVSPGVIIDYSGGLQDDSMLLEGTISYQNAATERFRGAWIPQDDGTVRQELRQWNSQTEQWDDWFIGIYHPTP